MICPDCEMEIDKLTTQGRCKQCSVRYNQLNYLNKKNGTNKEYVPLKELKGTTEYKRVMAKRKGVEVTKPTVKHIVRTVEADPLKEAINKIQKEVEVELSKTLKDEMTKRGVSELNNTLSLAFILPSMYDLFQEENTIKQRMILDAIYENQIIDSLHILKQENKDDFFLDTRVGARQRMLQELRTPNKYELELYRAYKDFIDEVKSNKDLMNMLIEANVKFQKTLNNQKNPVYRTNSEFMKDYDFVIVDDTSKDRRIAYNSTIPVMKNKYRVRIYNCKGLFGNPTPQTFMYKNKGDDKETYLEAPSEQDALNILKAMMRDHFSSVKYSPKDIEIVLWEDTLKEKECL